MDKQVVMSVGCTVIIGWTAFTVVDEFGNGFVLRANNDKRAFKFSFGYGAGVSPYLQHYFLTGYRRFKAAKRTPIKFHD